MSSKEVETNPPLVISPNELVFTPSFNRVISNTLKLFNSSKKPVSYKVKTTARKKYCVRPNIGILQPKDTVEVQVLLNSPKDFLSTESEKKDKFQVQSIFLNSDQVEKDLKEVWKGVPENQIIKQKLKCYSLKISESPIFPPTISSTTLEEEKVKDENQLQKPPTIFNKQPQEKQSEQPQIQLEKLLENYPKGSEEILPKITGENNTIELSSEEREEYLKQLEKLKEKVAQLEKEKEETLRKRKIISTDLPPVVTNSNTFQEEQQTQQKMVILMLIVAIISFILGRIL